MVNVIHMKWCSLVMCNNRRWVDQSRNEMNNTVAMCPLLLLTPFVLIFSCTLIYLGDTELEQPNLPPCAAIPLTPFLAEDPSTPLDKSRLAV